MNSNTILTTEVIDIIFENRNKNYGAYILRKQYPERIKTALLIMLALCIVFSAFSLWPSGKQPEFPVQTFEDPTLNDFKKDKELPKEKPKSGGPQRPSAKLVSTFTIVDNKDSSDIITDVTHLAISNVAFNTDSVDAYVPVEPGNGEGGNGEGKGIAEKTAAAENTNVPVLDPDIQASFPGGSAALIAFLERNLQVPSELDAGAAVQVKIKFVVGFDGKLQSFAVEKDGGEVYNEEVIRVLKKMPQWIPGKKGGHNVPVYYSLPVKFTAND